MSNYKNQIVVLAVSGLLWLLLLSSAIKQTNIEWQGLLIGGRVLMAVIAFVGAVFAKQWRSRNLLSIYFSVCCVVQALYACLEPANSIEYYEYIAYIYLFCALSFNGSRKDWYTSFFIINTVAIITPLFFKDIGASTIGEFVFRFTTTVVILFIASLAVNINATKFIALKENLALKNNLLVLETQKKSLFKEELEAAKNKLELYYKKETQIEVATKLSHDIRGPISFIQCYMASGKTESAPIKEALKTVVGIAEDMIAEAKKDFLFDYIDYEQALLEIIEQYRFQSPKVKIDYVSPESISGRYPVPLIEFKRIFQNLIKNSIEATRRTEAPKVYVFVKEVEGRLQLKVKDNGSGSKHISKIGEKGFTFGKGEQGSGFGVYYAKKTINSYDGRLTYSANSGNGLTATVEI